jgi:hypothetical protein
MENKDPKGSEQQERIEYEPPKVITLDVEEILEELGPARACYGHGETSRLF